jgi:F-type H+-transporting ATPase subunit epsilon
MAKAFNLTIINPTKTVYEGKVISAVVPAALGYLGILANHAPLAANLVSGKIILQEESGARKVFYHRSRGFLEILKNKVTIILNQNE